MTDPLGPWPMPDAQEAPTRGPSPLVAFVDESMRRTDAGTVEYLMAATVVSTGECDEVRRALKALVPRKNGKLHWRDESRSRRELVAKTIRGTGARSVVARLTVSHGKPLQEPMLWVPDAVAGAAGDRRCGQSACFDVLRELIDIIEIGTV